jgi:hypothetical protein
MKDKCVDNLHTVTQESINSWGNPLVATGGVLQWSNFFCSIISFEWINGEWKFSDDVLKGEFDITVTLPGGSKAAIGYKNVDHAERLWVQ